MCTRPERPHMALRLLLNPWPLLPALGRCVPPSPAAGVALVVLLMCAMLLLGLVLVVSWV